MIEIAVVDYGLGNVRSIRNAFETLGARTILTSDLSALSEADGIVLPGVGAFPTGMANLKSRGLDVHFKNLVSGGKPALAICLGMQLLFDFGEEFELTKGLGIIPGRVVRMPVADGQKLPHVCWNEINPSGGHNWDNSILSDVELGTDVYFVHSFCGQPEDEQNILTITKYGDCSFCSGVRLGNLYGFQFHPEKSGPIGLKIINNFLGICG